MKRFFKALGCLTVAGVLLAVFAREPLTEFAMAAITDGMFTTGDNDDFDPGLAVGEPFPTLKANLEGRIVSDMGEFIGDRGMIFIANRSSDW